MAGADPSMVEATAERIPSALLPATAARRRAHDTSLAASGTFEGATAFTPPTMRSALAPPPPAPTRGRTSPPGVRAQFRPWPPNRAEFLAFPGGFENREDHWENKRIEASGADTRPKLGDARLESPGPQPEPGDADADAALREAIKVAVDAGMYERAARLLEVLRGAADVAPAPDLATRRE